jgi:preprotein translocase subunit SecF
LFIGAGLLQAGTLKDLALVLFVGMLAGTYSSICIATPLLADLKEREPKMKALRERISARESSAKRKARVGRQRDRAAGAGLAGGSGEASPDDDDAAPTVGSSTGTGASRRVVQQGPRQQPIRGSRRSRGGKK